MFVTGIADLFKEAIGQMLLWAALVGCIAVGVMVNSVVWGAAVGAALWVLLGALHLIRTSKKHAKSRGFQIPASHD